MRYSKAFGAIDAGVVLAGLSLLSQVFKQGRQGVQSLEKGYHQLERDGMAPPAWTLPLIGIGAAAATIAAINPDRVVPRAIKWLKSNLGLSPSRGRRRSVTRARTMAAKAKRRGAMNSASKRTRKMSAAAMKRARANHLDVRR